MEKIYIKTVYEVKDKNLPIGFRVEITKEDNYYYGISNYKVWGPKQATPYQSISGKTSIEEALDDAIEGALAYSRNYPQAIVFWEEDGKYIDSNGNIVDIKHIKKTFSDYNK